MSNTIKTTMQWAKDMSVSDVLQKCDINDVVSDILFMNNRIAELETWNKNLEQSVDFLTTKLKHYPTVPKVVMEPCPGDGPFRCVDGKIRKFLGTETKCPNCKGEGKVPVACEHCIGDTCSRCLGHGLKTEQVTVYPMMEVCTHDAGMAICIGFHKHPGSKDWQLYLIFKDSTTSYQISAPNCFANKATAKLIGGQG